MKTGTINQTIKIPGASAHAIYEVLMDSKKHAKLVNSNSMISRKIGGKFEIYDGYIKGTNIELIDDAKIVQYWRGEEECWPSDHYSILTIELKEEDGATTIKLFQEKVPEECISEIDKGWHEFYWEPLKKLFKK